MSEPGLARLTRLLQAMVLLGAGAFAVVYVAIAIPRILYPFELEWMEGAMLDGVRRVLAGEKLYVAPSVEFVSYPYPPLYYWISAAFAAVMGLSFAPLRLVSFLASIGCLVVIFLLVRRETRSAWAGALGACLFAATFPINARVFDIARTDSLAAFLLLWALYLARFAGTRAQASLAAVMFCLAFLAKQITLAGAVAIALHYLVFRRRLALPFVATLVAAVGGSTLLLDRIHGGWFWFYNFAFHFGREINPRMFAVYWQVDLLALDIAVALGAFFLLSRAWRRETLGEAAFWLLAAGAIGAACAQARSLALGAAPNVVIPMHAVVAVLFGFGVGEAVDAIRRAPGPRQWFLLACVVVACGLQFSKLVYDPTLHVPSAADRQAGERLVERLRRFDGDVFVPCHAWLPAQAGKRTFVHAVGIYDSVYKEPTRTMIRDSVLEAFRAQRFAAVVMDYVWSGDQWLQDALEQNYRNAEPAFDDRRVQWPVTGFRTRPETIWVPKSR